jgi:hypothetical protein
VRERDAEDLGHFARLGPLGEGLADPTDHRGDDESGHRFVGGQGAQNLDEGGGQADFLLRLTQGGGHGISIAGVLPPARKGDLAGVVFELRGAFGEDHVNAARPLLQGTKHPRRPQHPAFGQDDRGVEVEVGGQVARQRERPGDPVDFGGPGHSALACGSVSVGTGSPGARSA